MSAALKRFPATIDDLLAIPEHERFHEIVGGDLVRKAMPSFRHGRSQAGLLRRVDRPYGRRPGGRFPGGWWFVTETEVLFEDHEIYRPDIAGWRRERMPEMPADFPVVLRPDWVCEILSPSNTKNDVVRKKRTYHRCQVPHYWVIDPVSETLEVHRWTDQGYLIVQSAEGEERIAAEPFEAVRLSVRGILEGDEDDDEP